MARCPPINSLWTDWEKKGYNNDRIRKLSQEDSSDFSYDRDMINRVNSAKIQQSDENMVKKAPMEERRVKAEEIINNPEYQKQIAARTKKPEDVVSEDASIVDIFGTELSGEEASIAVNGLLFAGFGNVITALDNKNKAEQYTKIYFGSEDIDTTAANAFKHACWHTLNTKSLWGGADAAQRFADAHENKPDQNTDKAYINAELGIDTTLYNATNMDLHNNAVGIAVGVVAGKGVSDDDLARMVYDVVISKGQGIWDGHGLN